MTNALAFAALAEPMRSPSSSGSPSGRWRSASWRPCCRSRRPAVSQHLKVLKEAQLVRDHAEGTRRIYCLDPAGLGPIRAWLDRFWDQRARRLCRGRRKGGQGMNVETQRISPAPIRRSLRVKASQEKAFDTFVGGMGGWWMKSHRCSSRRRRTW